MGMDTEDEFMEIEMLNHNLDGLAIRDIQFPHDVLIISISRKGYRLVSHGYTWLEYGDHVTVVGSPYSLEEVEVKFEV